MDDKSYDYFESSKKEWERRAKKNAVHYIETNITDLDFEYLFKSGEEKFRTLFLPVINKIKIGKRSRALEIGCGVGRLMRPMSKYFDEIVGVDISKTMIDHAKKLNKEYRNLRFQLINDVTFSKFKSHQYDFIYSYEVFQHFPNSQLVKSYLKQISRLLSTKGWIYLHFRLRDKNFKEIVKSRILVPLFKFTKLYDPLKLQSSFRGLSINLNELREIFDMFQFDYNVKDDPSHSRDECIFILGQLKCK